MAKTVFEMPAGNAEFDELEVGEKMQFSGSLRKEEGGQACLVTVDGATVPGYSDSEEDEEYEEGEEMEAVGGMAEALDEVM